MRRQGQAFRKPVNSENARLTNEDEPGDKASEVE